jgi:hypothetical protein
MSSPTIGTGDLSASGRETAQHSTVARRLPRWSDKRPELRPKLPTGRNATVRLNKSCESPRGVAWTTEGSGSIAYVHARVFPSTNGLIPQTSYLRKVLWSGISTSQRTK